MQFIRIIIFKVCNIVVYIFKFKFFFVLLVNFSMKNCIVLSSFTLNIFIY